MSAIVPNMNLPFGQNPTPLHRLTLPANSTIKAWLKRDDLNHPLIQGNKWHKLKLNLMAAQNQQKHQLLTFGGAYSNHIAATAAAAFERGWSSIGIIRGDELAGRQQAWSPTLKHAQQHGMQLEFVDRQSYRLRHQQAWLNSLQQRYPQAYILPEGGSNELAVAGFESVIDELNQQCPGWTHLLCAVGTGSTLAGLAKFANNRQQIWGVASLKNAGYLNEQIKHWAGLDKTNWRLFTEFHGGGYGKTTAEIVNISQQFEQLNRVKLDPIYTAKLVFGFYQLLQTGAFAPDSRVVLYHSGGLQGRPDAV
jgi:1-aminocyclopropane-1-carboxylate deaminase